MDEETRKRCRRCRVLERLDSFVVGRDAGLMEMSFFLLDRDAEHVFVPSSQFVHSATANYGAPEKHYFSTSSYMSFLLIT